MIAILSSIDNGTITLTHDTETDLYTIKDSLFASSEHDFMFIEAAIDHWLTLASDFVLNPEECQ